MADLSELSDHIYEEYRTYLFKYNKALEILIAKERIQSENEKLKIENLTLKLQLREIKIEKTAADFTAQTKMRMMREELGKMMKKTMNRKLLISSELRKLDSDNTINRTSNWVNSQKARTRKRKLGLNVKGRIETISESGMTNLVRLVAKQKRPAKIMHLENFISKVAPAVPQGRRGDQVCNKMQLVFAKHFKLCSNSSP
jgi:hypothetical protein